MPPFPSLEKLRIFVPAIGSDPQIGRLFDSCPRLRSVQIFCRHKRTWNKFRRGPGVGAIECLVECDYGPTNVYPDEWLLYQDSQYQTEL